MEIPSDKLRMVLALADLQATNPTLRHEPLSLDEHDKQLPWPCVWPGCMEPCLESGTLCSEHEMAYIVRTGKRSPVVNDIKEWNDQLHLRTKWLMPLWLTRVKGSDT